MWSNRLRTVLRLNAALSVSGGLIAAVAAGWVSDTLGVDQVLLTRIIGIGLVVFAADVAFVASRPEPKLLSETRLVSAADALWVVATVVVLVAQILTVAGVVVAVVLGLAVADFALTQLWMRSKALAEPAGASGDVALIG